MRNVFLISTLSLNWYKISIIFCFYIKRKLWNQIQQGICWDPINRFNIATYLCLSLWRKWISKFIYRCPLLFMFSKLKWEVFVLLILVELFTITLFLTFTFVVKILRVTRGCWWRWFTIDVLPFSLNLVLSTKIYKINRTTSILKS